MKRNYIKEVDEIQKIALNILKYLDHTCKEYGLTYFVSGGTLLGAVRHHGFIPWDDDIDVWMPRKDYERLFKIINEQSDHPFQMIDFRNKKHYYCAYAKIIDVRTTLVERTHSKKKCEIGIYIDIFPYDGLPKDKKKAENYMRLGDFLYYQYRHDSFSWDEMNKKSKGNSFIKWTKWILRKIIGKKNFIMMIDKYAIHYPIENSVYIGSIGTGYRKDQFMHNEFCQKIIPAKFQDIEIMIPSGYDEYLTKVYGDYMKLPPIEERNPHHNFVAWWKE